MGARRINCEKCSCPDVFPCVYVSVHTVRPVLLLDTWHARLVQLEYARFKFVSLPYTFCDINSRSPVLTTRRALLFLVDQQAAPLMTRHLLSAPS